MQKAVTESAGSEVRESGSNAELRMRRQNAVPRGVSTATPFFAARAEGAQLWDEDGRRDVLSKESGEPDGATAKRVTQRAAELGLIVLNCGVYGEGIRLLVPLIASDELIGEGLDLLESALEAP